MSQHKYVERIEIDVEPQVQGVQPVVAPATHSEMTYGSDRFARARQAQRISFFILGLLEALLGLRIFLRLMAANPNAGFAQFIYNLSYPFLLPFFGLVPAPAAQGMVLEVSTIIAMIVYALLFLFINQAIKLFASKGRF